MLKGIFKKIIQRRKKMDKHIACKGVVESVIIMDQELKYSLPLFALQNDAAQILEAHAVLILLPTATKALSICQA